MHRGSVADSSGITVFQFLLCSRGAVFLPGNCFVDERDAIRRKRLQEVVDIDVSLYLTSYPRAL